MARWTLRSLAGDVQAPADVLRKLNEFMFRQNLDGRFITLVYAVLDLRGDEARVTLACAGHPQAIVVSDSGEPVRVNASGDLLGVWPEIRVRDAEVRLSTGAALVLYTDGVTDRGAGVERSPEQALRRVNNDRTVDAPADALVDEARRWTGAARDDVAIIGLRYLPSEDRIDDLGLTGAVTAA